MVYIIFCCSIPYVDIKDLILVQISLCCSITISVKLTQGLSQCSKCKANSNSINCEILSCVILMCIHFSCNRSLSLFKCLLYVLSVYHVLSVCMVVPSVYIAASSVCIFVCLYIIKLIS